VLIVIFLFVNGFFLKFLFKKSALLAENETNPKKIKEVFASDGSESKKIIMKRHWYINLLTLPWHITIGGLFLLGFSYDYLDIIFLVVIILLNFIYIFLLVKTIKIIKIIK